MKVWMLIMVLVLGSASAMAQQNLDDAQNARYQVLIEELRCLVCQNQTIAESNAPLAKDLRDQVERQILAGRSDEQILAYMTERYGDFVRYRPPLDARTAALWGGPFFLVLLGLFVVWRQVIRNRRAQLTEAADPQAVQRLLDEVKKT